MWVTLNCTHYFFQESFIMQKYKKTVVVTGAASGIGQFVMNQYAVMQEYSVIGVDINEMVQIDNARFFKVDLCCHDDVGNVFKEINRIDIAINCAGVSSTRKPMLDFYPDEITKCWQENFFPAFNAMQNEISIMIKGGSGGKIINIASISAHFGMKGFLAYSLAKSAIINMTKVAAIEHAEAGIKINSISPATIDTPMIRNKYSGVLRDYSSVYHTKNCGTVNDVFSVIKMLESNEFMTGADIKIDGGKSDLLTI